MVADVPLGAFLSGGIDSTIIVGLMQAASSRPVKTFSIGFDDPAFDESRYAEMAARHLGTEHHAFVVEPRGPGRRCRPWPGSSTSRSPTARRCPPGTSPARRAGEVTVALTGDAGDELFAGYDRYRALALAELLRPAPGRLARRSWEGRWPAPCPASSRAKTRLRRVRRWLEGIGEPPESRYLALGHASSTSPAAPRLYSDDMIDALARAGAERPRRGRPGSRCWPAPSTRPRDATRSPGRWSPTC